MLATPVRLPKRGRLVLYRSKQKTDLRMRLHRAPGWIALLILTALQTACMARAHPAPRSFFSAAELPFAPRASKARAKSRVEIITPVLADRIQHIARQSPSFRAAWDMVQASGVPVRVGTYAQLQSRLPRWYRQHPAEWAGVTVISADARAGISGAIVVVRITPLEQAARGLPPGNDYVRSEIDRVLIHEIYGHLAPVVASGDARQECPDQLRPGEATPCVQLRERKIAAELNDFRLAQRAAEPAPR